MGLHESLLDELDAQIGVHAEGEGEAEGDSDDCQGQDKAAVPGGKGKGKTTGTGKDTYQHDGSGSKGGANANQEPGPDTARSHSSHGSGAPTPNSARSLPAVPKGPPPLGLVLGADPFDARSTAGLRREPGDSESESDDDESAALRSAQSALYGEGRIVMPAGALRAVRRAIELAMRERATLLLGGGGGEAAQAAAARAKRMRRGSAAGGAAAGIQLDGDEEPSDPKAKQSLIAQLRERMRALEEELVHLSMGFRHADLTLKQRDVVRLELQKVRRSEARAVQARD